MGLKDDILGAGLNSLSSTVVAGVNKKVSEVASSVFKTGIVDNFTKIGASAKSFAQVKADALFDKAIGPKSLVNLATAEVENTESAATASQVKAAAGVKSDVSLHRFTLKENGSNNIIVFEVMPEIVEQHTIEYEAIAPPQFPGAFQKFKGNSATQWQLNVMFISRTSAEAQQNYKYMMMLRGWTKPFYGERTAVTFKGRLGAPPPVLTMSGLRNLIGPVPVVITSLNWTWQKDVDYISTGIPGPDGKPIPFPTILSVPIQLVESYSINQFNSFSLADYRAGKLGPAFNLTTDSVANNGLASNETLVNDMGRTPEEEHEYLKANSTITSNGIPV